MAQLQLSTVPVDNPLVLLMLPHCMMQLVEFEFHTNKLWQAHVSIVPETRPFVYVMLPHCMMQLVEC